MPNPMVGRSMERARDAASPDVAPATHRYRTIWRSCLIAGILGALTITPLVNALQVEIEVAAGAPKGAGVREAMQSGAVSSNWEAVAIIAIGVVCIACAGRFDPRRVLAGTLLLPVGAALVLVDGWLVIEDVVTPAGQDVPTYYAALNAAAWMACAVAAVVSLVLLAGTRTISGAPTFLTQMAAFERLGRDRRRAHRTWRPSRLLWLVAGAAVTLAMTVVVQFLNAIVLREQVLGIPRHLYRDPAASRAYIEAKPVPSLISALGDLVQIVLTVVLAVVVMRFFWRLVLADARRLLDDPDYRPIVFLRSFGDDAATVTSKRLFDRLTWRKRRLEEVSVAALAPLGAAIAIGQPGERLPKLGAIRAYYPDDQWQAAVLEWMRRARLIVLVAGVSRWTLWELQQALERGYHDKLVLVLPPDPQAGARTARWQAISAIAASTTWAAAITRTRPEGVLAAIFTPDTNVLMIKGHEGLQSDYEAALRLAVVEMQEPGPPPGPAR
jgi:hypothetical protein